MDGFPGASTMLILTLADLSLKETFKMAAPIFSILEPPHPLKILLHGKMVIGKGKCWRSVEVITQASVLVSTFKLMLWRSWSFDLGLHVDLVWMAVDAGSLLR